MNENFNFKCSVQKNIYILFKIIKNLNYSLSK